MALSSRRRRRRQATSPSVSYRQNSYRAVVGPVARPTRVKTRTTVSRRVQGAVGWTANQRRALERLLRLRRRRSLSSPPRREAVRSISLVERSNPRRNRGRSGPCIRRPSPAAAGRARQAQLRSGAGSGAKADRLASFRVWC